MPYCTWRINQTINPSKYLKRPTVYLAVDRLAADDINQEQYKPAADKPRRSQYKIRQTDLYHAELEHACLKNGCMKLFNPTKDRHQLGDMLDSTQRELARRCKAWPTYGSTPDLRSSVLPSGGIWNPTTVCRKYVVWCECCLTPLAPTTPKRRYASCELGHRHCGGIPLIIPSKECL